MPKFTFVIAVSMSMCGTAVAADVAAGKAKVDEICSECHEKADWADTDAATLQTKIKDVVAGKVKHKKKIKLTDEEMANVAAYWTSK